MTGGGLWSEVLGGVPGGVRVSMDGARPRERRLTRSVGPRLVSCVPSTATFELGSASFSLCDFVGSSVTGA